MIVFLAALHALPVEVLGAAELDNCGWFAKLVYIIVPMLRATVVNLLVLSFIDFDTMPIPANTPTNASAGPSTKNMLG